MLLIHLFKESDDSTKLIIEKQSMHSLCLTNLGVFLLWPEWYNVPPPLRNYSGNQHDSS